MPRHISGLGLLVPDFLFADGMAHAAQGVIKIAGFKNGFGCGNGHTGFVQHGAYPFTLTLTIHETTSNARKSHKSMQSHDLPRRTKAPAFVALNMPACRAA